MAYILAIETATKNCSVALSKDGVTLLCKEIAEEGYSHAERLHVFIEQLLSELELSYKDLSAIAVSQGPGSYTGLRIGVSAAKGLCFALDIPLIAIDTLASLASQINIEDGFIVPMIDARRMEVYSAIFNAKHQEIREIRAEILTAESFSDIDSTIYFIGDCAEKSKTVLNQNNHIYLDAIIYPSAKDMGALSYEKFTKNDTVDVAYFEPYYLKDFVGTVSKK
jgi:tRNA threonylcarbamoyladenosine biosynthesis protein TsaB